MYIHYCYYIFLRAAHDRWYNPAKQNTHHRVLWVEHTPTQILLFVRNNLRTLFISTISTISTFAIHIHTPHHTPQTIPPTTHPHKATAHLYATPTCAREVSPRYLILIPTLSIHAVSYHRSSAHNGSVHHSLPPSLPSSQPSKIRNRISGSQSGDRIHTPPHAPPSVTLYQRKEGRNEGVPHAVSCSTPTREREGGREVQEKRGEGQAKLSTALHAAVGSTPAEGVPQSIHPFSFPSGLDAFRSPCSSLLTTSTSTSTYTSISRGIQRPKAIHLSGELEMLRRYLRCTCSSVGFLRNGYAGGERGQRRGR